LDFDSDGRCDSRVDRPLPEIVYESDGGRRVALMAVEGPPIQPAPTIIFGKRFSIDADEFFVLPGYDVSICAPIELRRRYPLVQYRGISVYAGIGKITVGKNVHFKKGDGLLLDSYTAVTLEDGVAASATDRGIGIVGGEVKIGRGAKLEGDQIYLEGPSITIGQSSLIRSRKLEGFFQDPYMLSTTISTDSFKADRIRLEGPRIQVSGISGLWSIAQLIEITNSRIRNQLRSFEPPTGLSLFGGSVNLLGTRIDQSSFDYIDLPPEM
jgi:hypothetical protein